MAAQQPPRRGRPKGDQPPKQQHGILLRPESVAWINENLPRGVSLSAFVCEAVEEKIRRLKARR